MKTAKYTRDVAMQVQRDESSAYAKDIAGLLFVCNKAAREVAELYEALVEIQPQDFHLIRPLVRILTGLGYEAERVEIHLDTGFAVGIKFNW